MSIDTLNHAAENCLDSLWRASWQGAVAVGIVWVVCLCFRRLPHSVKNILWGLVCAKMLLALSPASVGIPVPARPTPAPISAAAAPEQAPFDVTELPAPYTVSLPPATRYVAPPPPPVRPTWQVYVCAAWLLGSLATTFVLLAALARVFRMARRANSTTGADVQSAAIDAAIRTGLSRAPRVLISHDSNDVLTLGFFRPAILLPAALLERLPEAIPAVFAHECIHIRRGDPLTGLLPQFTQIVFFFHPLVWFATREFNFSREAVCDQAAMAAASIEPNRYGRLLLAIGARQDRNPTLCLPGASSHFHLLRRRIAMLDRISHQPLYRPRRTLASILALSALLAVLPISLVQAQQASHQANSGTAAPTKSRSRHASSAGHTVGQNRHGAKPAMASSTQAASLSTNVFNLQFAKAAEAASTLNRLFKAGGPEIVAEPRTNSILVRGSKAEVGEVTSLLTNLDQPSHDDGAKPDAFQTHILHIKYARAEEIARELQATVASHGAASIAVDSRTNTLVVLAAPRSFPSIDAVARELDIPTDEPVVRQVPIRYWKAQDMAKIISGPLGHPKGLQDITVDTVTNSLVITAPEDVINRIQLLTSMFDVESERTVTRRVKVLYGNADDIGKLASSHLGHPKDVVSVTVDHGDNSIVITATEETINHFQTLVNIFDTPPKSAGSPTAETHVIPLKSASAEDVYAQLSRQLKSDSGAEFVTFDPRSNSVIVSVTPSAFPALQAIVKALDKPKLDANARSPKRVLQVYPLKNAKALDVAQRINAKFQSSANVKASADEYSNSIIVSSIGANLDAIKAAIRSLDVRSKRS